jgi:hypothetical protein
MLYHKNLYIRFWIHSDDVVMFVLHSDDVVMFVLHSDDVVIFILHSDDVVMFIYIYNVAPSPMAGRSRKKMNTHRLTRHFIQLSYVIS